jgi:hypothetical protein
MIQEDAALNFAAASLQSVWALELLLTLKRDPARRWNPDELIRELRSSQVVVADAVSNLLAAGLAVEEDGPLYRYQTGSAAMDELVQALEKVYAEKPTAVIRAIIMSQTQKLKLLSDAFRIKE